MQRSPRVGLSRLLVVSVVLALATAASVQAVGAQEPTTWERIQSDSRVAFGFSNEPNFSIAEFENVSGLDPEVLKAILGAQGIESFDGTLVEFAGLIPGLNAGRFDVFANGVAITPARCEEVSFANPIGSTPSALGVLAGNPKNLHSLADIAADPSVTIAPITGGLQVDWLTAAGIAGDQITAFPTTQAQMAALQAGRVDAVIMFSSLLDEQLDLLNDPGIETAEPFETPLTAEGLPGISFWALGVVPEDSDLLQVLNEGMAELHASGRLLEILLEWGFSESQLPPSDLTAAQICAGDYTL